MVGMRDRFKRGYEKRKYHSEKVICFCGSNCEVVSAYDSKGEGNMFYLNNYLGAELQLGPMWRSQSGDHQKRILKRN